DVNLDKNWGNLVILYHGQAVYSKVCHLSPGTLKVRDGQVVRRGEMIGSCGNSGRSAVPHLHFQLQPTGRVGSPTLPLELHDVIDEGERMAGERTPSLRTTYIPEKGRELRNVQVTSEIRDIFEMDYDRPVAFDVECDGRVYAEEITPRIDLYGHWILASNRGATLYYEGKGDLFTVYDVLGERDSLLHALRAALARVPFEADESLRWRDFLPLGRVMPWPMSWAEDFVSPFMSGRGLEMSYGLRREGEKVYVEGTSAERRGDEPLSSTIAVLSREGGIERVEWNYGRRRCVARRRKSSSGGDEELGS
ncbi:MAG: M23 family metallopeptidase, partial [Deltaproteobacteria bacterium]|nr:M23 family metallopeptidase [Deltaproteobacteria bacterium]